jgi:16S rRNA (guanine966-N2)-methyltransferase
MAGMRISGGDARGIRLKVPKGIRPASEKVRQAVFSSVAAHVPDARVLDLFSGSGAYALEALSRGASDAVLVDQAADAVTTARANAKAAGLDRNVRIRKAPVARYLARQASKDGPFDLVFVDPPYGEPLEGVLEALRPHLAPDARVVVETRFKAEETLAAGGLLVEADRRYGDTRVLMLSRGEPGSEQG